MHSSSENIFVLLSRLLNTLKEDLMESHLLPCPVEIRF